MPVWLIALLSILVLAFAAVMLPHEVRLYRRSRQRRGGVLELDTQEARLALSDPDDWFVTARGTVVAKPTQLRRCNPARRIHYHGAGDRCQCGELPNVRSRDDAA